MSILSIDPAFTMIYSTLHRRINFRNRKGDEWNVDLQSIEQQQNEKEDYFTYLSNLLSQYQLEEQQQGQKEGFCGGLIGYFGYEMKRESLSGYVTPNEQQCQHNPDDNSCQCMREPDAGFQFIDRFWKFDHLTHTMEACCLIKTSSNDDHHHNTYDVGFHTEQQAHAWLDQAVSLVTKALTTHKDSVPMETTTTTTFTRPTATTTAAAREVDQDTLFTPDMEHEKYVHAIDRCIHEIGEGESYELCLTTQFHCSQHLDKQADLTYLYTHYLRKNNPAPYSALLQFPMCRMTLLSSSPERFLSVSKNGVAEMKPIKGTIGRIVACACKNHHDCDGLCWIAQDEQQKQTLWQDVKERAENLMVCSSFYIYLLTPLQ